MKKQKNTMPNISKSNFKTNQTEVKVKKPKKDKK